MSRSAQGGSAEDGSPQGGSAPAGLVQVSVTSGTRRVDLVLPGVVPVAELLPELARSVGVLDPATVHGGYRLLTPEGRELVGGAGLVAQGVADGALLTVTAGVDEEAPRVYDDVVEAMADVVERDLRPWRPSSGRRTALAAAVVLLSLGAGALLAAGGSLVPGAAAAAVAVLALTGATVCSRSAAEHETAAALGGLSCLYGAVAGLLLGPSGPLLGLPLASAGAGAALAALAALVVIDTGRPLLLPPAVAGLLALAVGLLSHALPADPRVLAIVLLVLVVLAGSVFPWLALAATRALPGGLDAPPDRPGHDPDRAEGPDGVDRDRVLTDARLAHDVLLGILATVGLLLVLVAPLAVSRGVAGTLLSVTCCAVVMLRTRQQRSEAGVLVGLVGGLAGLATVAVSVLLLQPDWRPWAAVVLAVAGAMVVLGSWAPATTSVRRGRLGDLAETSALLALLPLAVLATGLFSLSGG